MTVDVAVAVAPFPTTRSLLTNEVGGVPFGVEIVGSLLPLSLTVGIAVEPVDADEGEAEAVSVGEVLAVAEGLEVPSEV